MAEMKACSGSLCRCMRADLDGWEGLRVGDVDVEIVSRSTEWEIWTCSIAAYEYR